MHITESLLEEKVDRKKNLLDLRFCDIRDDAISTIMFYLKNHRNITTLDISFNYITLDGAKALATNSTLIELYIEDNELGATGAQALATNSTLRVLNVKKNNIGDQGAQALATNTTLTTLDVGFNNIGTAGGQALAMNTTLRILNARNNSFGNDAAKAFAINVTLTSLDLRNNRIYTEGAQALAENTTLTTLDLGDNYICAKGAQALAANTTLTSLGLWSTNISSGARALAANTTLLNLDIRHNHIDDESIKTFINSLKNNTTLLQLSHSFADKQAVATVTKILTRNKIKPLLKSLMHARLMAQAQRTDGCPLGWLPIELAGMINDEIVGANHFTFFATYFTNRPKSQDLKEILQMVHQQ